MQTEQLKVSFFAQAKRADQHGNAPICGRIVIGRTTADFSVKLKAPLTLWDSRKQRLLGKSHAAVRLNQRLNDCSALMHTRYRELCERGETVSATQLRDAYQGQMQEEGFLLKNFEAYLRQIQERIGVDRALKTFKLRTYQLSLLREYVQKRYKVKDIALSQLNKAFIEGFEHYLTIDRGLKRSSIEHPLCLAEHRPASRKTRLFRPESHHGLQLRATQGRTPKHFQGRATSPHRFRD